MTAAHSTASTTYPRRGDATIVKALAILDRRLRRPGEALTSPQAVRDYLRLCLAELEHEVFIVFFLDAQNRMIEARELFRGTLTQVGVYPREVAKAALQVNAGSVILAHNHPSGLCEPSRADEALTQSIKHALGLIDVKVLDHFLIAGHSVPLSFAERGLL